MKAFDIQQDLSGTTVVLRAALNVPLESGAVSNTLRLISALKTIERLARAGARLTVLAHIGRERTMSLRSVWEKMKKHTALPIQFVDDIGHERALRASRALKDGEVLLLENTRRERGEEENDPKLAETFASYGEVFINDAFPASHRAHASIVGIPRFIPSYAGPNFMKEYEGLLPARTPHSPSLAIVGGAKSLTKEPLIFKLITLYDRIFIGGALANDFFSAQGYEVGKSLVAHPPRIKELLENNRIVIPRDVVVFGPNGVETKMVDAVHPNDTIFDIGPASLATLAPHVAEAHTILWNGPLGYFEGGYKDATETLARSIARSGAVSIVGGGDTENAIHNLRINGRFTFVSTAGGAMLDFVAHGTLPGIEALG